MVSRKEWFDVDGDGFSGNQESLEPWMLVRELVSNSFDEPSVRHCKVVIGLSQNPRGVLVEVHDDGKGFDDPKDIFTLFGRTGKRQVPGQRGRFNMGEKQFLSICRYAKVLTGFCEVEFLPNGTRTQKKSKVAYQGVHISAVIESWTKKDIEEIVHKLQLFIPPNDKSYAVQDCITGLTHVVRRPHRLRAMEETLDTVLEKDGVFRPTKRKTVVEIFKTTNASDNKGWLFELGIPIQPIDCPFYVSVEQKVPLSPNRDSVRPSYIKAIYAIVANAAIETLEEDQIADTWVSEGICDDRASDETRDLVRNRKYGKTVLRSSDSWANEQAMEHGFNVIDSRTIPKEERDILKNYGLQTAGEVFKRNLKQATGIPQDQWSPAMKTLAEFCQWIGREFTKESISVSFHKLPGGSYRAEYYQGHISWNWNNWGNGRKFTLPLSSDNIAVAIHEACHKVGEQHNYSYQNFKDSIFGQVLLFAARNPKEFQTRIGIQS